MSTLFRHDSGSDGTMNRPAKRQRLTSTRSGAVNSRGATACERCRARKTKCDNIRPRCGHCAKHEAECVYADDAIPDPFQELGERVLGAIEELATVVKRQKQCCQTYPHGGSANGDGGLTYSHRQDLSSTSPYVPDFADAINPSDNVQSTSVAPHGSLEVLDEARLESQGTDAILLWPIWGPWHLPTLNSEDTDHDFVLSDTMPNMGRKQLVRLTNRYINGVHVMNPILNLTELKQIIHQTVETGPDWTTRTCLIALVAAIGSLNTLYHDDQPFAATPDTMRTPSEYDEDAHLAAQYWSLAVKRLALAIGQNNVQAVQCLCLAGIFCMHRVRPLQAWKYFNLAGAAWHILNKTKSSDHDVFERIDDLQSFTLMQSLYFTIWKSESELKLELDVPGPILDNVNFPSAFPLPPELDAESPAQEIADHERVWLYYLAEIAVRHHLNRLLKTYRYFAHGRQVNNRIVNKMLVHADMMEMQINEWRASLPAVFQFEIPEGFTLPPYSSEGTLILRTRYLNYRELVCRPFLRLCIETPVDLNAPTRDRVIELASQSVRFSVMRITQAKPCVHQGTWIGLRTVASSALIMSSVHLARQNPWLSAAQEVILPDDWKETVRTVYDMHTSFFAAQEGGASDIGRLLESLLAGCDSV